jgi:hypothetical protein
VSVRDRRAPQVVVTSRLRVLSVGRTRASVRRAGKATLARLMLNEDARVVFSYRACRSSSGRCRPRGEPTERTLRLRAGRPRVLVGHVFTTGLPRRGRYELRMTARDVAGNRGRTQRFVLRIRA